MRLRMKDSSIDTFREYFNDCDHKLTVGRIKDEKRCMFCWRRSKVVIGHYNYDENEQNVFGICKKHFKEIFPNYSLDTECAFCKKTFKCVVQRTLYTKKELREFKKKFIDARDFELK